MRIRRRTEAEKGQYWNKLAPDTCLIPLGFNLFCPGTLAEPEKHLCVQHGHGEDVAALGPRLKPQV